MSISDQSLPLAQQENLLALLAHSDEHGKLISQLADPNTFEGDYRTIAEGLLRFWYQQGQAPKAHTSDIFADILEDEDNRKAPIIRRVLVSMYQLANEEGINAKYVLDTFNAHTRGAHLKQAVYRAAEIVNSATPTSIEETEQVLQDILVARNFAFDLGMRLTDTERLVNFLREQSREFTSGVETLDRAGIVPARKKLMELLCPSGIGKTWFLVNIGKLNLLRRKKVIHYSGELDEEDLAERYWQALFAAASEEPENDLIRTPYFKKDANGDLRDIGFDEVTPEFLFDSEHIIDELGARLTYFGEGFFSRLIIKRFPKSWGPNDFRNHMDALEATEGFVPDLVLWDSQYHMKTDLRQHRLHLGKNVEESREIAKERNHAAVGTHQVGRDGMKSGNTRGTHAAEDISIFFTADNLLTMSATEMEKRLGLARMYVEKARKKRDKWGLLITQNYDIGQFCLASMRLTPRYFEIRGEIEDEEEGREEEEHEGFHRKED